MRRRGMPIVVLLAPLLVSACGLLSETPGRRLHAKVIGEAARPVGGAAVNLRTHVGCGGFLDGTKFHWLPTLETTTDAEGRFKLSAPWTPPRWNCLGAGWTYTLLIVKPGYFPAFAIETNAYRTGMDRPLKSQTFALRPLRYAADLVVYDVGSNEDRQPIMRQVLQAAREAAVTPLAPLGMFASAAGAVFERVAVIPGPLLAPITLAQDSKSGALLRWSADGNLISTESLSGGKLVGGRLERPIFERGAHLYFFHESYKDRRYEQSWVPVATKYGGVTAAARADRSMLTVEDQGRRLVLYDLSNLTQREIRPSIPPGSAVEINSVLEGGDPPVECLTRGRSSSLMFIAHAGAERALFASSGADPLRARRIEMPAGALDAEVTACASTDTEGNVYYVAQRGRGLRRVDITTARTEPLKPAQRVVAFGPPTIAQYPELPSTFVSLAVGRSTPPETIGGAFDQREVLYAVARDGLVYRFTSNHETRDLRPDQQIGLQPR